MLYFADTRFPIERANGLQTMATCHAMAERGHAVQLVVRPDTTVPARDPFDFYGLSRVPGLSIQTLPVRGGAQTRRAQYLLQAAAVAVRHKGVIFTRDLGLAAFLLQWPSWRRPRVIYESHGIAPVVAAEMPMLLGNAALAASPAKLARLDRRERRVWRRAAAYITITRALADELSLRYGTRTNVYVVPDGAREPTGPSAMPDDVPSEEGALANGIVGYAGHLYPWKGVDVLLRAVASTPTLRALIVGGHPAEPDALRVRQLAGALGVQDRVEFTGQVPSGEVMAQLLRASVLVLPNTASAVSERYTSPLKLFEYLAAGRPIVASDFPAIREVLTADISALLVPAGDATALAEALMRITSDPALARRLACASRALAPEYTWAARARRLDVPLQAAVR
ncbi:MAG: glycosyltransferase family 4 protein [Vicinamibacterales bacterium]